MTDAPQSLTPAARPGQPAAKVAPAAADIAGLSFEDAMTELDAIVRRIEAGGSNLDDAIASYERGVALKKHCESKLREAEARIEKITVNAEGGLAVTPF